jgi:hypothetical protein
MVLIKDGGDNRIIREKGNLVDVRPDDSET